MMDDDEDEDDDASVCPFVRQRGARVGRFGTSRSFVTERNGTSRARRRGRRRRRLEWFTSFQIEIEFVSSVWRRRREMMERGWCVVVGDATAMAAMGAGRRRRGGRRYGCGGCRRGTSRVDASSSSSASSDVLAALEREVRRSGTASTSPSETTPTSLSDAANAVAGRSATMPLRDRVVCALAAECVAVVAETPGMEDAPGHVCAALREAIRAHEEDEARGGRSSGDGRQRVGREVKLRCGYSPSARGGAKAHAWLEIEGGKVVDVCVEGLALAEAARRAGIDYDDEEAMRQRFGEEALTYGAYSPGPESALRPMTVLNVVVHTAGSKTTPKKPASGLTLKPPPATVAGAARAVEGVRAVESNVIHGDWRATAPKEILPGLEAIASARVETVASQEERLRALGVVA